MDMTKEKEKEQKAEGQSYILSSAYVGETLSLPVDSWLQHEIAQDLAKLKESNPSEVKRQAQKLQRYLNHPNLVVRSNAIQGLGLLLPGYGGNWKVSIARSLVEIAQSNEAASVRRIAAQALAQIGSIKSNQSALASLAEEGLTKALTDPEESVQAAAAQGLIEIEESAEAKESPSLPSADSDSSSDLSSTSTSLSSLMATELRDLLYTLGDSDNDWVEAESRGLTQIIQRESESGSDPSEDPAIVTRVKELLAAEPVRADMRASVRDRAMKVFGMIEKASLSPSPSSSSSYSSSSSSSHSGSNRSSTSPILPSLSNSSPILPQEQKSISMSFEWKTMSPEDLMEELLGTEEEFRRESSFFFGQHQQTHGDKNLSEKLTEMYSLLVEKIQSSADSNVRHKAAQAIGLESTDLRERQSAVNFLLQALSTENPFVPTTYIRGIHLCNFMDALELAGANGPWAEDLRHGLEQIILKNPEIFVRRHAVQVLGRIAMTSQNVQTFESVLNEAQEDHDSLVSSAAKNALAKIQSKQAQTGQSLSENLKEEKEAIYASRSASGISVTSSSSSSNSSSSSSSTFRSTSSSSSTPIGTSTNFFTSSENTPPQSALPTIPMTPLPLDPPIPGNSQESPATLPAFQRLQISTSEEERSEPPTLSF